MLNEGQLRTFTYHKRFRESSGWAREARQPAPCSQPVSCSYLWNVTFRWLRYTNPKTSPEGRKDRAAENLSQYAHLRSIFRRLPFLSPNASIWQVEHSHVLLILAWYGPLLLSSSESPVKLFQKFVVLSRKRIFKLFSNFQIPLKTQVYFSYGCFVLSGGSIPLPATLFCFISPFRPTKRFNPDPAWLLLPTGPSYKR